MSKYISRNAFTLAEVLITLGILGVVAAMTIPTLIEGFQVKSWNGAASSFEGKLGEAMRVMNSQGLLAGNGTTERFISQLQKQMKIVKVCEDTPTECTSSKVTWGDKEIDLSTMTSADEIVKLNDGETAWGTNIVGVQFINGTGALMAYNPRCYGSEFDSNAVKIVAVKAKDSDDKLVHFVTNCIAMIYDISTYQEPNTFGHDVRATDNIKNLSEKDLKFTMFGENFEYDNADESTFHIPSDERFDNNGACSFVDDETIRCMEEESSPQVCVWRKNQDVSCSYLGGETGD